MNDAIGQPRPADPSRPSSLQLLAGVPAVIAISLGLLILTRLKSPNSRRLEWCRSIALNSMDSGDFKTASVCYARLLQADPSNRELAFNLAQTLAAIGQPEGAHSLMVRLASMNDGGYLPAHLWLARQALSDPEPSQVSLSVADQQIAVAIRSAPEDPDVNACAALLYAREENWDAVAAAVSKTGDRLATLADQLYRIAMTQGNIAQAAKWKTPIPHHS